MEEDKLQKIIDQARYLMTELRVRADIQVSFDDKSRIVNVQIDSPEAAFLIGFHGETLQAIQTILMFLSHRVLGEWVKLAVNIGDYRQKREEQLRKLALNLAMKVKFSKESQCISSLSSAERRIIHLVLADHPDVITESEGEGKARRLIIKPKTV